MLLRSLTAGTALVPRNRPYRRPILRSVMFQPREPAVNGRRRTCRGACTHSEQFEGTNLLYTGCAGRGGTRCGRIRRRATAARRPARRRKPR